MMDEEVELAIEAAARNGDAAVVEALQPEYVTHKPFLAAAANGHVRVLQLLFKRTGMHYAYLVLQTAAEFGHVRAMELVFDRCGNRNTSAALAAAAGAGHIEAVKMLVQKFHPDEQANAYAITQAAKNDRCDVLRLLIESCSPFQSNRTPAANNAFDEAKWGESNPVRDTITREFNLAARGGRVNIVKLFLDLGQEKRLDDRCLFSNFADVLGNAAMGGCVEVAKLLVERCGDHDVGQALGAGS